jgi:hypothetical protein
MLFLNLLALLRLRLWVGCLALDAWQPDSPIVATTNHHRHRRKHRSQASC